MIPALVIVGVGLFIAVIVVWPNPPYDSDTNNPDDELKREHGRDWEKFKKESGDD